MATLAQFERLLKAMAPIVDRHAEFKEGSGLLYVPLMPREMKELRSALEPFRWSQQELDDAKAEAKELAEYFADADLPSAADVRGIMKT